MHTTDAPSRTRVPTMLRVALLACLALCFPACGGGGGGGGGGAAEESAAGQGNPAAGITPAPSGVPILYAAHSIQSVNGDVTSQVLSRVVLGGHVAQQELVTTNFSYSFARSTIRPWTSGGRLFVTRQQGVGLDPGDEITYSERNGLDASPLGGDIVVQRPIRPFNQALLGDTLYADGLGAFRRFPLFGSQNPTPGEQILAPGAADAPRGNAGAHNGLLYDAEVTDNLITFFRRTPSSGALTPIGSFVRDSSSFHMFPFGTVAWVDGCAVFARASRSSDRLEIWAFCDTLPNVTPAARLTESAPIPGLHDVLGVDVSDTFVCVHLRRQSAPGAAFDNGAVFVYDISTGTSTLVELDRATYDVEIQVLP